MNPANGTLSPDLQARIAAAEAAAAPIEADRERLRSAANLKVLPGPLAEAFLPSTLTAAGLELRPVVPSDYGILQAIDSPILQILGGSDEKAIQWSTDQIWELVFLWTRPVREARAALALKPGDYAGSAGVQPASFLAERRRQNFRETALAATADKLPADALLQLTEIGLALGENFRRSFSTAVAHEAPPAEDGSFLSVRPAAPAMASAGG